MSALGALLAVSLVAQPQDPRALPPPPTPVPRAPNGGSDDGPNTIRVAGGVAYRVSGDDPNVPTAGLSLAASFEHRYMTLAYLELGAALNAQFDRFSTETIGMSGTASVLTQNTFALLQTAAVRTDRWRFWAGVGAGVSVTTASSTSTRFAARGALGAELTLRGRSALALLGSYIRTLPSSSTIDSLADVDLAYVYRF